MPCFMPAAIELTNILLAIIALLLCGILAIQFLQIFNRKEQRMSDIVPHEESAPSEPVLSPSDSAEHEQVPVTESLDAVTDSLAAEITASEDDVPIIPATEEPSEILPPDPIFSVSNDILVALRQLTRDFETKLKYDASKQELIDKLYKENMEFKEGIIKKFQHTMILAVVEKLDEADKDIAVFANRDFSEENYRKLLDSYRDIAANFQDMLSIKFDVEYYRCEPLTGFDPKTQRSLKTCPTAEDDKHKLVKQTLRPGYKTADGFILRPELVEVFIFDGQ